MNDADPRSRRAVEGLDGTLAALRDGLAAELLIAGEAPPDVAVWIGPGLADAATAKEQLTARGITPLGTDRADEALARAAAGTGASLFFIPAGADRPRDGVAALESVGIRPALYRPPWLLRIPALGPALIRPKLGRRLVASW